MRTVTKAATYAVIVSGIAVVAVGCGSASTSANAPTVSNSAIQTNSQGNTVSVPASASAGSSGSSSASSGPEINTATVTGLGTILVNSQGQTLYMFVPDKQSKVTCVGACASVWPPAALTTGQTAVASGGAKSSLLGSDKNPSGGEVVTYNKWPLYTYVADTAAGTATGQAVNLNGGLWYVMSPSGAVIKTKA